MVSKCKFTLLVTEPALLSFGDDTDVARTGGIHCVKCHTFPVRLVSHKIVQSIDIYYRRHPSPFRLGETCI